jgi:hypothetical protein
MNGRILVLNQPAEMHTPAEYLFPTGMPLELFQEAVRICKLYHGANCRPQSTDTIRNLKVYDIERREIICAPVGCQYVALSYVWGKQNASLNADRLSDFRDLPGTVADSCVVVQKLGFRYMSIDRYVSALVAHNFESLQHQCIDQDSHSAKMEQIMQMKDIYAAAHLVLIAASGNGADHGLRLRLSSPPELVHPQTSVGDVRLLLCHPLWDLANINKTPWAARAWTFQECYFAKRRLFIYHGQAAYRCNSSSGSFGKAGWYPQFDRQDLRIEYTKELVQGYTGRQLTFESDALPTIISALSGDERQDERRDIWGLPVDKGSMDWGVDASLALLWRHDLQCARRPTLPSWSPIAWTGAVSWPMAHDVSARGIRLLQAAEGVLKFRSSMQQGLRRTTRCHDTWRSRAEY